MDLSNLRPADGAKHNDNFRRGRGQEYQREGLLAETLKKSLVLM